MLKIINNYLEDRSSLAGLIKESIEHAFGVWETFKPEYKTADRFKQFCSQTQDDLKRHRIEPDIINSIISGLEKKYGKENKKS